MMSDPRSPSRPTRPPTWIPIAEEAGHPLASLEGKELAGGRLRLFLGRSSRFGARYFSLYLDRGGTMSESALLTGLHNQGPLPSYNWIEVAATQERVTLTDGAAIDVGPPGIEHTFRLLLDLIPPGGHIMVEYDSPQRAETARALALGVPALATPLGELLFRIGCGAHLKDWQIAEGGSEGPRKLQAYLSPSEEVTARWKREGSALLREWLAIARSESAIVLGCQQRAKRLLPLLA